MNNIYAVRDRIANELVGVGMYVLFVFRTDQQAIRYFADGINDPKSMLYKHPDDYELVKLGALQDSPEGQVIVLGPHQKELIITGSALIAAQPPSQES